MKTSYFGRVQSKNFKDRNLNLVCVARGHRYYSGRCYPDLYPSWDLINNVKDEKEYEKRYKAEVLDKLDPLKVWNELGEDAVIICHEKYADILEGKDFCHRHMIARWLEEELWLRYDMDVQIEELEDTKAELKDILKKRQTSLFD